MRVNVAAPRRFTPAPLTHEGARASRITAVDQLRRLVVSCMLFEDTFYVDGKTIADQISAAVAAVLAIPMGADIVANIAYEARTKFKLRHAPLWLINSLLATRTPEARAVIAGVVISCVQRPDELAELLAMYWKTGKRPLSGQLKKGLAAAFLTFNRYSLSKYANKSGQVKMRDVLFLTHANPRDAEQAQIFKELAEGNLKAPDTWESNLSAGADKKATFTRLINEGSLGALAMLRNLRNMQEAHVDESVIRKGLAEMKVERVLPFRFITAARYAPSLEQELESAMFRCLDGMPKLSGKTALVVDASGSMNVPISSKSEMTRFEAAAALSILAREICEQVDVTVYSNSATTVPPRRGFGLRDAMRQVAEWGGTDTQRAVMHAAKRGYDRIIVFTDEQSHTAIGNPLIGTRAYVVNVASYQNGVGYGPWTHIDGMSEAVLDFIQQHEAAE